MVCSRTMVGPSSPGVAAKAAADLETVELPVVVPLAALEALLEVAGVAQETIVWEDERVVLAQLRALAQQVRELAMWDNAVPRG